MHSSFVGQKAIVPRETGEPQCGTIVGETPRLFAVVTDISDIIMVEKRHTYPYDAEAFQHIKDVKRKFLESRTSLESAWAGLVPLAGDRELHRVKGKPSDGEVLEMVRNVVSGELRQEQPEFTFEESDVQPLVQPLLKGDGTYGHPLQPDAHPD